MGHEERERREQLIRRDSPFPASRPPYGERCLILWRLEDLGAPPEAMKLLNAWSSELCRKETTAEEVECPHCPDSGQCKSCGREQVGPL
jgi:hypothetical protein